MYDGLALSLSSLEMNLEQMAMGKDIHVEMLGMITRNELRADI